jgi:hypothetical protein
MSKKTHSYRKQPLQPTQQQQQEHEQNQVDSSAAATNTLSDHTDSSAAAINTPTQPIFTKISAKEFIEDFYRINHLPQSTTISFGAVTQRTSQVMPFQVHAGELPLRLKLCGILRKKLMGDHGNYGTVGAPYTVANIRVASTIIELSRNQPEDVQDQLTQIGKHLTSLLKSKAESMQGKEQNTDFYNLNVNRLLFKNQFVYPTAKGSQLCKLLIGTNEDGERFEDEDVNSLLGNYCSVFNALRPIVIDAREEKPKKIDESDVEPGDLIEIDASFVPYLSSGTNAQKLGIMMCADAVKLLVKSNNLQCEEEESADDEIDSPMKRPRYF